MPLTIVKSEPLAAAAPPPAAPPDTDALVQQARSMAEAGDVDGANAMFLQIPPSERARRGLYSGPGGGDATGPATNALVLGNIGVPIGRAVLAKGLPLAARAAGTAKAVVTGLGPIVKYEATKNGLEYIGFNSALATAIAAAVSGYKKGGVAKAEGAAAAESAAAKTATTEVAATAPVAAAETSAVAAAPARSAAPASTPRSSPPRLSLKDLTPYERQTVEALVKDGYPEDQVLTHLADHRATVAPPTSPAAAAPAPPAPLPAAAGKPKLLAIETKEYTRLRRIGKSDREAMDLIVAQRQMAERLRLPTATQAARAKPGKPGSRTEDVID